MRKLKQWGYNPDYPIEVEGWKIGEKVPDWLSDVAKVSGFDGKTGDILLDMWTDKQGKFHIKDTYRPIDLLVIPNTDSMVVYGDGKLIVLDPEEIDFLYIETEE